MNRRGGGVFSKFLSRIAIVAVLTLSVLSLPFQGVATAAEAYTFAFRDAEITQVAEEILGSALGVAYTIDPTVTGKMSFRIDRRLTRAQLLEAFEAALTVSDVAMVREGDALVLVPRAKARTTAAIRTPGSVNASGGVRRSGYDVLAVPLSYATPSEVAKALEAMTGSGTVLYSSDKQGLVVLGGTASEVDGALETLKIFDRNVLEGSRIRWFNLNQAIAPTVAAELDKIVAASGVSGVTVIPLKRLNGLIVLARTTVALEEIARWVERLDVASREPSAQLWVYRPRSASAESLASSLNSVLTTTRTSYTAAAPAGDPAQAPASDKPLTVTTESGTSSGDGIRLGVEKDTNTLLVYAPQAQWAQIQRILTEMDRSPAQVLIEATILEVTLTDDLRAGVDWSVLSRGGDIAVSSVYNQGGAIGPAYPGFSVTLLAGDVRAAINALGSRTDVEVVSAPKILALDNHPAQLQIGDQVPVVTQTTASTVTATPSLVSTVDYRNTGVILNVTPRISGENRVVLEIAQEVSSVARTVTSGIDSPTIQQRKMQSTLVLDDGALVALGGLISTNKSRGRSGIPGLNDLPFVGSMFRSDSRNNSRTELIVFLKVRILPAGNKPEEAMGNLKADLREIAARGLFPAE